MRTALRTLRSVASTTAVALVTAGLVAASAPPAAAATAAVAEPQVDQEVAGSPSCDAASFPGFLVTTQALRQEIVPSRDGLAFVDLCLNVVTPSTPFTLNVRAGGTATAPGAVVGTGSLTAQPGFGFVRVTFPAEVATTPGQRYVLEIPPTQTTFQWRTTCGTAVLPCAASAPDRYPPGQTNFAASIGATTDFGFRTLPPRTANLTGGLTAPAVVCPGTPFAVTASVTNSGPATVAPTVARLLASADAVPGADDTVVAEVPVPALPPGTATVPLNAAALPASFPAGRTHLLLVTDADNAVTETVETDNVAAARSAAFCGKAAVGAVTLTADAATTPAGSYAVPLASIPVESIGFAATGAESTPLKGLPLKGLPLKGLPLKGLVPLSLGDVLSRIHLSDIPITRPGGWEALLVAPYANTPVSDVTLAEFLSLPTADQLTIGDVDLGRSPLRAIDLAGVATAGASLNRLAPNGPGTPAVAWCTLLGNAGYDCAARGVDPSRTTLVDLALGGVAVPVPWSGTPFAAMDLRGTPLLTTPLASYAIRQTPLRQLPLTALRHPATFASCTSCATLGEAEATGAVRTSVTLGDLLADLADRTAALGATTLGDYVMGLLPDRSAWPLGALGLAQAPVFAPTGTTLGDTVTVTSTGTAPVVDATFTVTPPPGFAFVPGSARLANPAGAAAIPVAEPTVDGGRLAFATDAIVAPGTSATLAFRLAPSLTLGVSTQSATAGGADQYGAVTGPRATGSPVTVADVEGLVAGQANDDAATAPAVTDGTLRLGHVARSGDVDYYRVPVPTTAACRLADSSGTAANACRIAVTLALPGGDPATDLDVVVYGPDTSSLAGAPLKGLPLKGLENDDEGGSTVGGVVDLPPPTLAELPLKGLPLKGLPLKGLSTARGTSDESVEVTTAPGDGGYLLVQVSGYNGALSAAPYVLRVVSAALADALAATCAPRTVTGLTPAGTAPTLPADLTTLVLVNQKRMSDRYGAAATATMLADLRTYATKVGGVVYPVESDAAVARDMTALDAAPCDLVRLNAVTTSLVSLVTRVRTGRPSLGNVVLVGADDIFPFGRVADRTSVANETSYVPELLAAQGTAPTTASAATGHVLTDDVYATDAPENVAGHPLYVPKWVVSRLVETPEQIDYTVRQFLASNGQAAQPPAQTALVAGYDFLKDGSAADADAFASRLGSANVARLICEGWTAADLANYLRRAGTTSTACPGAAALATTPVIAEIDGHAEQHRLLPAAGNTTGDLSDLFKPSAVATLPPGRVIFGVGCHFGLNLPNREVTGATADQTDRMTDFAETFSARAAVFVANTGYGYGDTDVVGYSEALMGLFAKNLNGGLSAGEALRDAKRQYVLDNFGSYAAYDEKVVQEAVLYGLPQFRVAGAAPAPPAPAAQALVTEPVTGLQSRPFDSGPLSFTATTTSRGTYHSAGGRTLAVHGRPVLPEVAYDVANRDATKPGYTPTGLVVTGFTQSVVPGYDPVFARAEYDATRPEIQSRGDYPAAPAGLTTLDGAARLLLWPGSFAPTSAPGAKVTGDLTLRSNVRGTVYYSDVAGPAPVITRVDTNVLGDGTLSVAVSADSAEPVRRVAVVVGAAFADLKQAAPGYWTGTVAAPPAGARILVQAVSRAGVGYWANKGSAVGTAPSESGLTLRITPTGNLANGWFQNAARVAVTQADGSPVTVPVEYSVDGGAFATYTGPIDVTGTGVHRVVARGYDADGKPVFTGRTVAVDATAPTASVTSPGNGAAYDLGQVVKAAFTCADVGSGVVSCTGTANVDTTTAGAHVYEVTVTDVVGNRATVSVPYTVRPDVTAPVVTITTPPNGAVYDAPASVRAAFTCADAGGSGLASCTGTVANGALVDTAVGAHTFSVTATDKAGNATTRAVTYTVRGESFDGFYSPIVAAPALNDTSAGNTVPFKFRLYTPAGKEITATTGFTFTWRTLASCTDPTDRATDPLPGAASSSPTFRYDAIGRQFVFNAITAKSWAGYCRRFVVRLPDGTERFALVRLT